MNIRPVSFPLSLLAASLAIGAEEPKKKDPASPPPPVPTSFMPVVPKEDFKNTMERMKSEKAGIEKKHEALLAERYDLRDDPAPGVTMARKKPVQQGVRVRLPKGATWDELTKMAPEQLREKDAWPAGSSAAASKIIPKVKCSFPKFEIDELKKQEDRDRRASISISTVDHLLSNSRADFLTTRPDSAM